MLPRVSITVRNETQRKIATDHLKCCPLCGSVNALTNHECYLCSWHGRFDHDPVVIEAAVDQLIERCPELADVMQSPAEPSKSLMKRIIQRIKRVFHRTRFNIFA